MRVSINDFVVVYRNLYKHNGKYYRLFAKGVSPNGCWLTAPVMIELKDIDVSTGNDIYGPSNFVFDVWGSVQAGVEYIHYGEWL